MAKRLNKATGPTKTLTTHIGKLSFHHGFAKGYPTKETVEKLYEERDFQRACQAYLWAVPAVAFAQWQYGQATFCAGNGVLGEFVAFDDKLGILTPNATTPYYLAFDADGSLTLYVQVKSPGKDKESNWLPAPDGDFSLYIRSYWPEAAITEGKWTPPPVKRA